MYTTCHIGDLHELTCPCHDICARPVQHCKISTTASNIIIDSFKDTVLQWFGQLHLIHPWPSLCCKGHELSLKCRHWPRHGHGSIMQPGTMPLHAQPQQSQFYMYLQVHQSTAPEPGSVHCNLGEKGNRLPTSTHFHDTFREVRQPAPPSTTRTTSCTGFLKCAEHIARPLDKANACSTQTKLEYLHSIHDTTLAMTEQYEYYYCISIKWIKISIRVKYE